MKKLLPFILVFSALLSAFGAGCGEKTARTRYTIECELVGNELTGREKVEFYNFTDNAFSELKFNLFGNAFRKGAAYSPISRQYESKAYPSGKNYGGMEISGVGCEGDKLAYEICGADENILNVKLKEEVFPNESVSVTIEYKLVLANVIARTGVNGNAINLANFYPALCGIEDGAFYECVYYANGDPFYSDCADYNVKLTSDEKFVVAASGKVVGSETGGGKRTDEYELYNARSFAFVLSEKFEAITETFSGTEIIYYYYNDENPSVSLKTATDAMKCFTELYGAYPYPTFSVVQTEFIQGGMEFPALVMISDSLEEKPYKEVIVHETAHQWWQTVVGNNEIKYGFLDEGLAEYSVVVFYEKHPDYGYTREVLIKSAERTYKTFCSVYDKLFGKADTSMLRELSQFSSEYEYVNMAYVKPAVMYDCLRTTIGDSKFFGGLKRYYADYAFSNATPDGLVASFGKVNADVNGFFDGFFNGKAVL